MRRGPETCGRKGGFTLVELLVVIGIIALLISILIPVLGRARDQANRVACLSNIRQIGIAFRMYASENKDWCPWAAPLNRPDLYADWIHWRTGINNQGLASSAIAPYLGGGKGFAKDTSLEKVFRCPADRLQDRPSFTQYPYSYTMNIYFGSNGDYPQACAGPPTRLSTTKNASEKILVAEENEVTINDGYWVPGVASNMSLSDWQGNWDWLSVRHDGGKGEFTNNQPFPAKPKDMLHHSKKGVVIFVDGHADVVPRDYAHMPQHVIPRLQL
jgi:prepilin-type N-terminal cleavage/methylation domain-containing protein